MLRDIKGFEGTLKDVTFVGSRTIVPKNPLISLKIPSNPLKQMKHIVESVEEMYHAREPTGEVIVDEVLDILRHYKLIYPEDVALLMDVNPKDLRAAWHMLTGTKLIDVITHWRVMQAQEWIRKRLPELKPNDSRNHEARKMLTEVAKRCGWRSERVMSHVFERYCGCSALEWLSGEKARSSERF